MSTRRRNRLLASLACVVPLSFFNAGALAAGESPAPYEFRQVMVPMRDGTRLSTIILTPKGQAGKLPILLNRTPYSVPKGPWPPFPKDLEALAKDGYIFVFQSLRGRGKSEGEFVMFAPMSKRGSKAPDETTDAFDTVDWLIKNVPANSGRVGIYGVSYHGLTAALALLAPHPALKAVSEQASPSDVWMNDDIHRYGALRLSYAVEYATDLIWGAKSAELYDKHDMYDWFLELGPLSAVNRKYLHGKLPFWNELVDHPTYDTYWKDRAWFKDLKRTDVPTLHVAGFWDQEDPWGPWQIYNALERNDKRGTNFIVAGPWYHNQWRETAASLGPLKFGEDTAESYRRNIEAPFFRHYLHQKGGKPQWEVATFQTGSNTWNLYKNWPPKTASRTKLYLRAGGRLSFEAPGAEEGNPVCGEYVSDPAKPVPYRARPIAPLYPAVDWPSWEVLDQRFADGRPDVLTFQTEPLEQDLAITGEVQARLAASTSGSDSDFIVKLIDVHPEKLEPVPADRQPGEYGNSLNGYQLPIAMEVRRGRYLSSFEKPTPLDPGKPYIWQFPLRDRDHVFRKGHRLMVQIQSSWFPLIDRNPQTFMRSIYEAVPSEFRKATQRLYCSGTWRSFVELPIRR